MKPLVRCKSRRWTITTPSFPPYPASSALVERTTTPFLNSARVSNYIKITSVALNNCSDRIADFHFSSFLLFSITAVGIYFYAKSKPYVRKIAQKLSCVEFSEIIQIPELLEYRSQDIQEILKQTADIRKHLPQLDQLLHQIEIRTQAIEIKLQDLQTLQLLNKTTHTVEPLATDQPFAPDLPLSALPFQKDDIVQITNPRDKLNGTRGYVIDIQKGWIYINNKSQVIKRSILNVEKVHNKRNKLQLNALH